MAHHLVAPSSGGWFHPSVRSVVRRPASPAQRVVVRAEAAPRAESWLERLERWLWRMEQRRVEDYLAQSADICDLEQRIHALERGRSIAF